MRILHFSDLHIGVENYGRLDPDTGLSTRLGDFLGSLDEVVACAIEEKIDLVLLAGDAYKGRDPSQTHQREFAKRLSLLSNEGIPTFILVGNHDLPNAVSRATAVDIFRTLQVPKLYIGDSLQTYLVPTPNGPLQILAVPWPRRGGILSRDESRGLTIDEIRQELENRITLAIQDRVSQLDPGIPAILTGHLTVNGATVGTERSMMLGQDHVLLASTLHQPQFEYVALGHIHKHQILRDDPPMIVYSGSLQRVDFTEEADQKGFCLIDLDPQAPQGQRLINFEFRNVNARKFITIDVEITTGDPNPTNTVINEIKTKNIDDAIVRIRILIPSELETHLRESEIRMSLENAHYIAAINKESEDNRRTRIDYDVAEGLQPNQALRLYVHGKDYTDTRQQKLISYGDEIINAEPTDS
ncbi:MAG: exonuclease SbcCD subunit D [Chloroflexota bacterium]|nr:exonuclease SbcCD subunit D [Chloroflexota bacterium]